VKEKKNRTFSGANERGKKRETVMKRTILCCWSRSVGLRFAADPIHTAAKKGDVASPNTV
jgi:hypothetical protein